MGKKRHSAWGVFKLTYPLKFKVPVFPSQAYLFEAKKILANVSTKDGDQT